MAFVCQQCKEPLQLDASLVDLAPSAYDTIASALPPSKRARIPSDATKWALLKADSNVKAIYQNAVLKNPKSLQPRGKQPQNSSSPLPNESFVLLQESILHSPETTPSSPVRSSHKGKSPSIKSPMSAQTPLSSVPLSDPDPPNPSPLSHHLRASAKLFDLLSSKTDIDHPLCAECTQILLNTLTRQLEETKKERDGYIAYDKELRKEKEKEAKGPSKEEADKRIAQLQHQEAVVIQELKGAEREREQLDEELRILELEEKTLELDEAEFWRLHNEQSMLIDQQELHIASLRAAYATDSATLDKLERTNVYNDAFCIGHDGVFGTINGLRLGRVPGVPVEWTEINAAWGQTLLLLYTIARKLDFSFENYRLIPMGSFSRIEKTTGDKTSYELYGSGDLHLGRLLHNRRFDIAMVAFLDCLKQLVDYIKSQDPSVEFVHQIVKDKIGDVSVKLQFNQEETWTRSLRHVLLASKICLKWATNGVNG